MSSVDSASQNSMNKVAQFLSQLVVNRRFVNELRAREKSCCALGLVEERR